MIELWRSTLDLNCQVVSDTGEYLRSQKDKYEIITLIDVLEHIPRENVVRFLKDKIPLKDKQGIVFFVLIYKYFLILYHFVFGEKKLIKK